jgi:hypothetical protein
LFYTIELVTNDTGNRTIGCAIELYNSINDPDLTEVLTTTNVITSDVNTYRFDFSSISNYTDFVGEDSITNIVNNTFALAEDAIFTDYDFDITGDVVVAGNLTAENLIVGSTNVITEINTKQATITDGSLTIARTSGLQTALDAKQATITTATDLECKSLTTRLLEVDTTRFFDTIVIRRPTGITGAVGDFFYPLENFNVG